MKYCAVPRAPVLRSAQPGLLAPAQVPEQIHKEKFVFPMSELMGPREQEVVELLLLGCDNSEIARLLKITLRTVKWYFSRLFLRFGITAGIKRVKLAVLLHRRQLCLSSDTRQVGTEAGPQPGERSRSSRSSPKDSGMRKSPTELERRSRS